jgi:S1-C subfamily serine protease
MRIRRTFATGLLFVAVLISHSAHSGIIPGSAFKYNKWIGQAYTNDKTGGFSICVVASTYVSGITLGFGVVASGNVNIGFTRPDWAFKVGQSIPGEIKIDQSFSEKVIGVASTSNTVVVALPPTAAIFPYLARGLVMTILTDAGSTAIFNLKDSYRALEMAHSCAIKYQAKLGAGSPQKNLATQKWLARNTWINDPRYTSQAQTAFAIERQLLAEGKDDTTSAFYIEVDDRLRAAGVVVPTPETTAPAAAMAPPTSAQPAPKPAPTFVASGTGIVVTKDGYIITNDHVIADCISDIHGNLTGQLAETLRAVSADEANDLALLKGPSSFQGHAVVRAAAVRPGDAIIVIGYPFQDILSSEFSVTTGIISSLGGIGNDSRYLQISAAVQPGNSGGPLLDASGNLVGVVSEKIDAIRVIQITGSIPENINFAIKTGALRDFLDKNSVSYDIAMPTEEAKVADIAERARSYTLRLSCTAKKRD